MGQACGDDAISNDWRKSQYLKDFHKGRVARLCNDRRSCDIYVHRDGGTFNLRGYDVKQWFMCYGTAKYLMVTYSCQGMKALSTPLLLLSKEIITDHVSSLKSEVKS